MLGLPTIIDLGGKEIAWSSYVGQSIQTYKHVSGIACDANDFPISDDLKALELYCDWLSDIGRTISLPVYM